MRLGSSSAPCVALCVVLAACSDAEIAPEDAGHREDASVTDAGPMDAGGLDAGSADAGRDAGPTDAGRDAGPTDAGPYETPGAGDLVISEIMPDSDVVTDDCGEWVELHNPSASVTYDLRGCTLHDASNAFAFTTDVRIPPGAFFSLSRYETVACTALGFPDGPGFDPDTHYTDVKLANEGDLVRLQCDGVVVDAVDFTTWSITKGASFNLDPAHYDAAENDESSSWCTGSDIYNMAGGEHDRGTPGSANSDC